MNEQLLKTSAADILSSRRKLEILRGGGIHPLPLYVRGLSMKCDMNNHLLNE